MGPIAEGIIVGVGSTVVVGFLSGLTPPVKRALKAAKRVDRIENALPALTRGVWALLGVHVAECNGTTSPEIKESYEELTRIVTDSIISQKAKP